MNKEKRKLLEYTKWYEKIPSKYWGCSDLETVNRYLKEKNEKQ